MELDIDDFKQQVKASAKRVEVRPSSLELEFLANVYIGAMYIYLHLGRLPEIMTSTDTISKLGAVVHKNRAALPEEYQKVLTVTDGVPTRYYLANMNARNLAYTIADNKELRPKLNNILTLWKI